MENFKNEPLHLYSETEKQHWLKDHVALIEQIQNENKHLPFKIINIKEYGFVAKVCGLFAYISYNHMPWTYQDNNYWKAVYPTLLGKVFFSKIHSLNKDTFSLYIDGAVPQFKKMELNEDVRYYGIILRKTQYYLLIDIGCNFNWDCGSNVVLLHKSNFNFCRYDKDYDVGNEIEIIYKGIREDVHVKITKEKDKLFNNLEESNNIIGAIYDTRVIFNGHNKEYWINDKYKARIPITQNLYNKPQHEIIKKFVALKDGDIIQCEVFSINEEKHTINLKWLINEEVEVEKEIKTEEEKVENEILNEIEVKKEIQTFEEKREKESFDDFYSEINKLIGTTVIIISKKKNKIMEFPINEKYSGYFQISRKIYSKRNLNQIELNLKTLQEGSRLKCKILGYDRNCNKFILKWISTAKDYSKVKTKKSKNATENKINWKNHIIIKNTYKDIIDEGTYEKLLAVLADSK